MQRKFAVFVDHRVARVVAALIAHDDVVIRGDQVYHAAFSFVTPVDSYDCTVHILPLLSNLKPYISSTAKNAKPQVD